MNKQLNTFQAAQALGISPSHMARLAKQGRIPGASQPGGRDWLFDRARLYILPPERDGRRRKALFGLGK